MLNRVHISKKVKKSLFNIYFGLEGPSSVQGSAFKEKLDSKLFDFRY